MRCRGLGSISSVAYKPTGARGFCGAADVPLFAPAVLYVRAQHMRDPRAAGIAVQLLAVLPLWLWLRFAGAQGVQQVRASRGGGGKLKGSRTVARPPDGYSLRKRVVAATVGGPGKDCLQVLLDSAMSAVHGGRGGRR